MNTTDESGRDEMEPDRPNTVLWWGRFNPEYSRSRILRKLLRGAGWIVKDFHPALSWAGDLQALLQGVGKPDLIWVPCGRQRDLAAARRYSRRLKIPLLFDPLISAYDKRVFEKKKYGPATLRAVCLRRWEGRLFQTSDIVLADTVAHAEFFTTTLGTTKDKVYVVPVGAEEDLFAAQPYAGPGTKLEVLFYGSFVHLQGADVIVNAARLVPEVDWVLLGHGKLRAGCEATAAGLPQVRFEDWVPYKQLASRIGKADILLGIFGGTPKAKRVIPNKFYQAIACARPIITLDSPVYGAEVRTANEGGVEWIPADDPAALAEAVRAWAAEPETLAQRGAAARRLYERFYAEDQVLSALNGALARLF